MHFSTHRSQKCTGHHHRESSEAQIAHTAMPGPPCGRRGCSDAVIQWARASSGRSAASLSQRHFCARQVGTVSHSAPEKKKQGSGNYWGVFGEEDSSLSLFFLTRGFAKMNVGCVVLACTLLVGASSVRWVNFFMSFRLTILWKCCTAVVLTWALQRAARALESGCERLTFPPQRCAKGNMMRVIELNTATFKVKNIVVKVWCEKSPTTLFVSLPILSPK